jgi:rubrerythrin
MEIEREGRKFYLDAAERTVGDKGKAMWRSLARQEALHIEYLTNARRDLVEKGQWASFGMEGVRFLSKQEIHRIFPKTAESKVEPDADELAALQTGIEMEVKSRDFYEDLAKKTKDPRGKDMYEKLAQWEETHRQILQAGYDYLKKTGFWLDIQELGFGV